jgi:hypothetical protein
VVGLSDLPSQIVWHRLVVEKGETGIELLTEAANALDMAGSACESPEDAAHFSALADRVRSYLAVSRPTTPLGMPRIASADNQLTDERVIHRTGELGQSHIRLLRDRTSVDPG